MITTPVTDINFALDCNARGPGFWKLDPFPKRKTEYINLIRTVIDQSYNEYLHDNMVNNAFFDD